MLHRLYATSPLLNFWPTNFPTYCNIGPTPAVYFSIIWGLGLRQFLGRAPRIGQARGPGAAATIVHLAAAIPRASRSDV